MKHSKFLNSGLIDYAYQKQLISEIIAGSDYKPMITGYIAALKKLNLVKEEIDIFNQLTDTYITDKNLTYKFISEIKGDIKNKLKDADSLNKQRQMFYEEVRKIMPNIQKALNDDIPRYKFYASIKNFVDDSLLSTLNAKERTIISENISENLMKNTQLVENVRDMRDANDMPKQADPLVVSVMIKEFCNKWKKTLSPTQYKYLVEYTTNGRTINKDWLEKLKREFKSINYKLIKDSASRKKVAHFLTVLNNKKTAIAEDILQYAEVLDTINEVTIPEGSKPEVIK
jgi:hypothetical protein